MSENDLNINKHLENISHFVDHTHLSDAKEQLLAMLNAAMYSEFINDIGADRRGDMVYFYRLLLCLIEAVYWLAGPIMEKFKDIVPDDTNQHPECPYCFNEINIKHD